MADSDTQKKCVCYHCGEPCNQSLIRFDEKSFCCKGCRSVYEILNQNQLCEYYNLNQNPGMTQDGFFREDKYAFLDQEDIQNDLLAFRDGVQAHVHFYIPQIHCSSCLWLLEHISEMEPGILACEVHFTHKEVLIVFEEAKISLRQVVELLHRIGYEPQLSKEINQKSFDQTHQNTKLKKLGIAGACFAGIMMMSLPDYIAGGNLQNPLLQVFFKWANLLLVLPAVFYSATEFYHSAWSAIRNRFLNTDAPVVIAILVTFIRSVFEVMTDTGTGYFDSLSGIIFFMLLGRVLQDKTYKLIQYDRDFKSYFPIAVSRLNKDKTVSSIPLEDIRFGEDILVFPGEIIPVDGLISKGGADIDYSFVSGESVPVAKEAGDVIYAGGKVLNAGIEVFVLKEPSQSHLTRLWNKQQNNKKENPPRARYTDWVSQYFTWGVFVLAILAGVYWAFFDYSKMWNAFTAVLIIACPCALLLSESFTNGNMIRHLSRLGLYLKNVHVVEKLSQITHIVLDKTGTLTESKKHKVDFKGKTLSAQEKQWIYSMVFQSKHPYSRAIVSYFEHEGVIPKHVVVKEIPGGGLEAFIENRHIRIGSEKFVYNKKESHKKSRAEVFVLIDREMMGIFSIANHYRYEILSSLLQLQNDFSLSIISGDNPAERNYLESTLGKNITLRFGQMPEDKVHYVEGLQAKNEKVLMIGDGLNDDHALKQSDCGLILCEENNNFFPGGDALLSANSLKKLPAILAFVRKQNAIIFSSFGVSIVYNLIGLWFAVQGALSPVIAAILMPASSLTIIFLTFGLTEWYGRRLGK